jgi:hypothetical protein
VLENIESIADELDAQLPEALTDSGSVSAQRTKYEQLTGRRIT